MKVIQASVKFTAGKEFESNYGGRPRQNVVFAGDDNQEYSKWFNAGEHKYCSLAKGQRVQLLIDDGKVSLIEPDQPEPPAPIDVEAHDPAPLAKPSQREIVSVDAAPVGRIRERLTAEQRQATEQLQFIVIRRAKLISSCHAQVASQFTNDRGELLIHPGEIQKYATALFISLREDGLLKDAGL